MRPTNARIWHKAVFRVGPVAGPKPTRVQQGQNTFEPVGFPLFGAPQAPVNKPNPPKEVKTWGDGTLRTEELSSAEAHPSEPPRGKTANRMRSNNCTYKDIYSNNVFFLPYRKKKKTDLCSLRN